jgi:hypothetical protein
LHPTDVLLWVETLDDGTMDLHSQLAAMEAQAKEVKFWVKKVKVRANESKLELGNAMPKFFITLRILETKGKSYKTRSSKCVKKNEICWIMSNKGENENHNVTKQI